MSLNANSTSQGAKNIITCFPYSGKHPKCLSNMYSSGHKIIQKYIMNSTIKSRQISLFSHKQGLHSETAWCLPYSWVQLRFCTDELCWKLGTTTVAVKLAMRSRDATLLLWLRVDGQQNTYASSLIMKGRMPNSSTCSSWFDRPFCVQEKVGEITG